MLLQLINPRIQSPSRSQSVVNCHLMNESIYMHFALCAFQCVHRYFKLAGVRLQIFSMLFIFTLSGRFLLYLDIITFVLYFNNGFLLMFAYPCKLMNEWNLRCFFSTLKAFTSFLFAVTFDVVFRLSQCLTSVST